MSGKLCRFLGHNLSVSLFEILYVATFALSQMPNPFPREMNLCLPNGLLTGPQEEDARRGGKTLVEISDVAQ